MDLLEFTAIVVTCGYDCSLWLLRIPASTNLVTIHSQIASYLGSLFLKKDIAVVFSIYSELIQIVLKR